MRTVLGLLASFLSSVLLAQRVDIPVANWTVPPYNHSSGGGITTMTDFTPPRVFVAVVPCRVVDTRNAVGPYGGPALATNVARTFDIDNGPCPGLPTGIDAYSLNFGGILPPADGFLTAWPTGSGQPVVSQLNMVGGEVVANAAIVPAGTGGAINVLVNIGPTHVYIDINGYFSETLGNPANFLELHTNSTGFVFSGSNSSTSCSGPCGISVGVSSGHAIWGVSSETNADENYGVYGSSSSSDDQSSGVYGFAGHINGNGGTFDNISTNQVYLATEIFSLDMGLYTSDGIFGGNLTIAPGPKMFAAPHPEDAGLEIRYASVEAPTVDVYFRGTANLVDGYARIDVPDHFRFTARDGSYMTTLTPVDHAVALRVASEGPDGILVRGIGNTRFHYVVYAERAEIEGFEPVRKNHLFTPEALAKGGRLEVLPETTRTILIRNGTLNSDGTFNSATARAQGWAIPERSGRSVERRP